MTGVWEGGPELGEGESRGDCCRVVQGDSVRRRCCCMDKYQHGERLIKVNVPMRQSCVLMLCTFVLFFGWMAKTLNLNVYW